MIRIDAGRYRAVEDLYFEAVYANLCGMRPYMAVHYRSSRNEAREITGKPRAVRMLVYVLNLFELLPAGLRSAGNPNEWEDAYLRKVAAWLLLADKVELKVCANAYKAKTEQYEQLLRDVMSLGADDLILLDGMEEGRDFLAYFGENAYSTLRKTALCRSSNGDADAPSTAAACAQGLGEALKDVRIPEALVVLSDLRVCPYCGRSFIGIRTELKREKKKEEKRTVNLGVQLDHFFSRSKFPFLAVSLYNLIPCCGICNLLKTDEDDPNLISPFEEEADFDKNVTFRFDFDRLPGIGEMRKVRVVVDGNAKNSVRYQANVDRFSLNAAYAFHQREAAELCAKMMSYPRSQIEEISRMLRDFDGAPPGRGGSDPADMQGKEMAARLEQQIFAEAFTETDDFGKRPLAKLYRDLYKNYRE